MKEEVSFISEDLLRLDVEVLLFFVPKHADKKEMEEIKCQKNIIFMSMDKKLKSASRYIKSTGEREHERYLEQVDKKNHLLFFSVLDHDGHFVDNIVDESVDVEKLVETQMMIEAVRNAISRLNAEERDIIERLYFNDETVRSVAKLKSITHPALIKRRNKILEKLKNFIEEL